MRKWKILAGIGTIAALSQYAAAEYFFRRTMIRQHATTERTMKMAGTNWNEYMPLLEECRKWMEQQPREDVWIISEDGLKLHGTYFPGDEGKKLVICFHGYTSEGMNDYIGLSNYYLKRGYRMLLVDERAHGKSEGTYIGFGCLDRKDVLCFAEYGSKLVGEGAEIWLHGTSMGAASVLMASSLPLPDCVKGIISDCAFTSAWEVFAHVLQNMYHLPPFPILHTANRLVKKRAGYDLRECNAAEEVKAAKVPILFIHGDSDTFVPCRMCQDIYRNCASPKTRWIVPGAGHAESFYKDRETYESKLTEFLNREEIHS